MNPTLEHIILIIDAHPVYALKLEGFLRGLTFRHISLTENGGAGIEAARGDKPGLALVSGMLPDMDATECCRQIRAVSPATRIIVQTGLFTEYAQIGALRDSGADHVLPRREKDWSPLQRAVEDCLGLPAGSQKSG